MARALTTHNRQKKFSLVVRRSWPKALSEYQQQHQQAPLCNATEIPGKKLNHLVLGPNRRIESSISAPGRFQLEIPRPSASSQRAGVFGSYLGMFTNGETPPPPPKTQQKTKTTLRLFLYKPLYYPPRYGYCRGRSLPAWRLSANQARMCSSCVADFKVPRRRGLSC